MATPIPHAGGPPGAPGHVFTDARHCTGSVVRKASKHRFRADAASILIKG